MNGINTQTPPTDPMHELLTDVAKCLSRRDRDIDLRARVETALARAMEPFASRPIKVPNVQDAMVTIEAMRAHMPITPEGIHAVVALAEEGARQLEQFAVRFDADRRAVAAWRAAHPGNDQASPDRADLVVWLMDVFDTTFDQPTVAQVEHVRARLGAAQLRAPNQLTKDARDIVDQLADALRKTSRRAFMAEERARAAEAANVQWEQRDQQRGNDIRSGHRVEIVNFGREDVTSTIGREEVEIIARRAMNAPASDATFDALVAEARKNGIVDDDAKVVWRQPGQAGKLLGIKLGQLTGYPVKDRTGPTLDEHLATAPHDDCADCRAMEADPLAEKIAKAVGDMIVWPDGPNDETTLRELLASSFVADADLLNRAAAIASATILGHADTEGEAMAMFEHLNCPTCGGSGHIDDVAQSPVVVLLAEAMEQLDLDASTFADQDNGGGYRAASAVAGKIEKFIAEAKADRASLDRVEARLDAEVLATVPAVERTPAPGVYSPDQGEPIGGKNTADYDRRQMEEKINRTLFKQALAGPALTREEIDMTVVHFAPGWEWSRVPQADPPQITLTRYAPGESE